MLGKKRIEMKRKRGTNEINKVQVQVRLFFDGPMSVRYALVYIRVRPILPKDSEAILVCV